MDVLREMAQGHGNARIAARLSLSESSVEKYVNAIFAKLGLSEQQVHRRVVAVLTYLRDGSLRALESRTWSCGWHKTARNGHKGNHNSKIAGAGER